MVRSGGAAFRPPRSVAVGDSFFVPHIISQILIPCPTFHDPMPHVTCVMLSLVCSAGAFVGPGLGVDDNFAFNRVLADNLVELGFL